MYMYVEVILVAYGWMFKCCCMYLELESQLMLR
jgi:hypothetical protein